MAATEMVALTVSLCLLLLAVAGEARRPVLRLPRNAEKTGSYIIVLRRDTSHEDMQSAVARVSRVADDSKVHSCVEAVTKAFAAKLSPYALEAVRRMPEVDYCEEEGFAVGVEGVAAEWHLDRTDQCEGCPPLDLYYQPIGEGGGADVYIMDSGIAYDHAEFENRAKYAGYDPIDEYELSINASIERKKGRDCHGHGTHVASLCGGKTFGSAKKVSLFSVRILDCSNSAPWSVVLDGMDYVLRSAWSKGRPIIMSMSIGGDYHRAVNDAIAEIVNHGIHVVVAAGNGLVDACLKSPASSPDAITVGGTRQGDGLYIQGSGTNYGACVDIFAPGERILAADFRCPNCSRYLSGTSMATPIVSGVVAILLTRQPIFFPSEIKEKLLQDSLEGVLDFTDIPESAWEITPNRLLNIQGGCGGEVLQSSGVLTAPGHLRNYPGGLHCDWVIAAETGQQVDATVQFVHLEELYDSLSLFEGHCYDPNNLVHTFTGIVGTSFHYRSEGELLCVRFLSDTTGSGIGFNITFSKVYSGTDLEVPEPVDIPTVAPVVPRKVADVQVYIKVPPKQARAMLTELASLGYKPTWITAYRIGAAKKAFFDFILTNSSLVYTIGIMDKTPSTFNETISEYASQGYFVTHLISRDRGNNPREPSFSAIFSLTPNVVETTVYLKDTVPQYLSRLAEKRAAGYRLVSHTLSEIQGTIQVASVFSIDKRQALNISFEAPAPWQSYHNLTFIDFTSTALQLNANNFFPSSMEVNCLDGVSYVAVIFEQTNTNDNNWFRWGLNITALRDSVRSESRSWDPRITVAYDYLDEVRHYLQFQRKSLY